MIRSTEQSLPDHSIECLKGKIGIDAGASVSDQGAEVMDFPGLSGFQDDAHLGALAFPDEIVVQTRNGKKGRNGGIVPVHSPVAQDNDVDARFDLETGLSEDLLKCIFK